jgi:FAD/FMN-containing dehydrogenase
VDYRPRQAWTNWLGNERCIADLYRPRTLEQLCRAVRLSAAGGAVRIAGKSAAWSPLVSTGGSIIDVSGLDRILGLGFCDGAPTIRVEAGATIGKLTAHCEAHGIALCSPTVYKELSVGGVVATASHGTGLGVSSLSDDVVAMTLITALGDVVELTQRDGERFEAARVSLGALGAIYAVTLRCRPAFEVHVEDRFIPRARVLAEMDDLVASYPFLEVYWFPSMDVMWCKMIRPCEGPAQVPSRLARLTRAVGDQCTLAIGRWLLPNVSAHAPSLFPAIIHVGPAFAMPAGQRVQRQRAAFHYQDAYPRCWSMSFAVPLEDAASAWQTAIELIEREARDNRYPVNMVVHARYIGASSALLSPAYGRAICDLEAVTLRGTVGAERFFERFAEAMYGFPGARPHWGKHILQPERIAERYPRLGDFLRHREALDPDGVFLNRFLKRDVFRM